MKPRTDRRSFLKLLSLLPLTPLLGHCSPAAKEGNEVLHNREAPNVLILVFDALSAGHGSLYGYHRNTTPNLARFAERSTVFHRHYAAGNFTTPGTASMLTGAYPWFHRALHFLGAVTRHYEKKSLFHLFAARGHRTITYTHNPLVNVLLHQFAGDLDIFKKTGDLGLQSQHTAEQAFWRDYNVAIQSEWLARRESHGSAAPSLLFLSLFDRVKRKHLDWTPKGKELEELFPRGVQSSFGLYGGSQFILEMAIDWIGAELMRSPQPFLGYFHLLPPHEPYHPRREFIGLFDDAWSPVAKPSHFFSQGLSDEHLNQLQREYDEHVAYADAEFGRLYDHMDRNGLLDNTCVVVTSDHGQAFERGIHGHWTETLYEAVIRVPLLIHTPEQRQRRDVYTLTSGVDLLPTLLHIIGHPSPDWCEGQILPMFSNKAHQDRSIFSVEAKSNPKQAPLTMGTVALLKERYKLIHYFGYDGYDDQFELYDLVNDPEEMEDLYQINRSVAREFRNELEHKLRVVNQPYSGSGSSASQDPESALSNHAAGS
jgi:arylsulfatase A-like enzyme